MNIISETATHKIESAGALYIPTKSDAELAWRDSELARTLEFVVAPDHPQRDINLTYRAALYAYDSQPDFPNGVRPTI